MKPAARFCATIGAMAAAALAHSLITTMRRRGSEIDVAEALRADWGGPVVVRRSKALGAIQWFRVRYPRPRLAVAARIPGPSSPAHTYLFRYRVFLLRIF